MYPGPLGLYTLSSLFRRSIFKPLILFLLKSWRKGLRRWSFPGSRVWMPLKCFKIPESTRAQPPGVSFIWLATPTKIWEIPPKNFLDNQRNFLKLCFDFSINLNINDHSRWWWSIHDDMSLFFQYIANSSSLEDSPENKHWFLRKLHYSAKTRPKLSQYLEKTVFAKGMCGEIRAGGGGGGRWPPGWGWRYAEDLFKHWAWYYDRWLATLMCFGQAFQELYLWMIRVCLNLVLSRSLGSERSKAALKLTRVFFHLFENHL